MDSLSKRLCTLIDSRGGREYGGHFGNQNNKHDRFLRVKTTSGAGFFWRFYSPLESAKRFLEESLGRCLQEQKECT
jgi:hypothetical protein